MLCEDGVERQWAVALREDEAVASRPPRIRRVEAHHVVEDVDDLERRVRALVVLLVAARPRDQIHKHSHILENRDIVVQVDASPKLKALGHPVRLGIALRLAAEGGTCACDFADIFGISQPAVSQHLKVLREAGLVKTRREGTQIYYSLDLGGVRVLQRAVARLAG